MIKYTDKQKLDAVKAYGKGNGGWLATAGAQGVNVASLRKWVAGFNAHVAPTDMRRAPRTPHRIAPWRARRDCGQAMARIGEDITEKLDIVPAEFFVHRHIRGKWACKYCQTLVLGISEKCERLRRRSLTRACRLRG